MSQAVPSRPAQSAMPRTGFREILFDTETTGAPLRDGHRIVEIGCLELIDYVPTGRTFHRYLNPERSIDDGALAVHGLTLQRLSKEPVFAEIADELLAFFNEDPATMLVAHNADFDIGFLNYEFGRLGFARIEPARVFCTLQFSRKQSPGGHHSLDALCDRYKIDRSRRSFHGALLDAQLLAEVYLELRGGRQRGLGLVEGEEVPDLAAQALHNRQRQGRRIVPSATAEAAHAALLGELKAPLWLDVPK